MSDMERVRKLGEEAAAVAREQEIWTLTIGEGKDGWGATLKRPGGPPMALVMGRENIGTAYGDALDAIGARPDLAPLIEDDGDVDLGWRALVKAARTGEPAVVRLAMGGVIDWEHP